jgi:uncharacterized protein (DUF433 family)
MTIFDQPAYRPSEAARILGLPVATVSAWCFGQNYPGPDGKKKRFQPVLKAADSRRRLLSFANLCELHVLSAIRRHHRVALPKVRRSLEYVRDRLSSPRPLLDTQFQTNGIDLFVAHASQLLNVSKEGQQALRGEFERALSRIERDRDGTPVRLFPFTRSRSDLADQPTAVVVDPRLAFGRPALVKAGVTTDVIEDRFRAGDSPEEMAADYGVEQADIWEAIRFELEQRRAA